MKLKKKFCLGIFILIFVSCKVQQTSVSKIYHIDKAGIVSQNSLIYSLPKTILHISVKATNNSFIKGPYCKYAYKYLGIENVLKESKAYWTIDSVNIETCNDIDPDNLFVVENKSDLTSEFIKLSEYGLISSFYNQDNKKCNIYNTYLDTFYFVPAMTDITVKRFNEQIYDTVYKELFQDSAYLKIPIIKPKNEFKSLEQKAEEAANFIIKLRKRRFKLIAGQYDFFPDGEALEVALKELNRIEHNYLSLFIGKWTKQSVNYTFEYIPENKVIIDSKLLFRFSLEKGILTKTETEGNPVFLIINKLNHTKKFNEFIDRQSISDVETSVEQDNEKIFYRIPEKTSIEIREGNNLIIKKVLSINQYGKILSIPYNFKIE